MISITFTYFHTSKIPKIHFQENHKVLTFPKLLKRLMNRLQLTKFSTDFSTSKSDAVSVVGFFLDISFCFQSNRNH